MLDLAEHGGEGLVPLRAVAERQGISFKYIERIMSSLTSAGLVEGVHGKGGGYRLCHRAGEYTVGEILRLTEGSLAPVACLDCEGNRCERAKSCKTLPMWKKLDGLICGYLDSVSIEELAKDEV